MDDDKKNKKDRNPFEEFINNLPALYTLEDIRIGLISLLQELDIMDETLWADRLDKRQDEIRQVLAQTLGEHFKEMFKEELKDVDEKVLIAMAGISSTLAYIVELYVKEVIEADDYWEGDIDE